MAIFVLAVAPSFPSFDKEKYTSGFTFGLKVVFRQLFATTLQNRKSWGWKVSKQHHRYINPCPWNKYIISRVTLLKKEKRRKNTKFEQMFPRIKYKNDVSKEDTELFTMKEEKKARGILNLSYVSSSSTTVEIYIHTVCACSFLKRG